MDRYPQQVAPPAGAPSWLTRSRAAAVLLALVALVVLGIVLPAQAPVPGAGGPAASASGDIELYRMIARQVSAGTDYYTAAVTAQLQNGYPTTPAVVVRPPTLTYLMLLLGEQGATVALGVLAVLALLAMLVRLARSGAGRLELAIAAMVLAANAAVCASGAVTWFGEAWAGVLVLLALAVRTERTWWPTVALGFAAVCLRELAVPFLLVMAVLAWRRRPEFLAWAGALGSFGVLYVMHALAVQAAQPAVPAASNGWLAFGGWPFVLGTLRTGSLLSVAPAVVSAVALPLALFGWVFAGNRWIAAALTGVVFTCALLVAGRPDNTYWGLLDATLVLLGLAFVPRGLAEVARALGRDRQG